MHTIKSISELLSLHPGTVKKKIKLGLLKATKRIVKHKVTACTSYCVEDEDLELYLKQYDSEGKKKNS